MFKYKKLYLKAVITIEEKQSRINDLLTASKEDKERISLLLEENGNLFAQIEKDKRDLYTAEELKKKVAAYQADIKRLESALSRSDEQCEGCTYKGRTQKCGTCTRNPRAVDKYTK